MKLKKTAAFLLAGVAAGSVLLGGCGKINQDAVVATLDKDTEITLGYANFVARYQQATYDFMYRSYYGDKYWTDEEMAQDGETLQETVKDGVMDSIELDCVLESHMADYNVTVTDEEKAEITKAVEKFLSDNTEEAIEQLGATQEYAEKMMYYRTVEHKMRDAIYDEVDTNVTDEEAAQKTYSYVSVNLQGEYDEAGTYQEYTEDQIAEIKETFEKAAGEAKEDFDGAAETYNYDIQTDSFGADDVVAEDDEAYDAVAAAADKLKEGEVSGPIESNGSYYIIRLDSLFDREATDRKKEEIVSTRQAEHYAEVTDEYTKKAEFEVDEKLWKKVQFRDLFTTTLVETEGSEDTSAPAE